MAEKPKGPALGGLMGIASGPPPRPAVPRPAGAAKPEPPKPKPAPPPLPEKPIAIAAAPEIEVAPESVEPEKESQPPPEVEITERAHYAAGDVIASKYELTKLLGEGGMGAVWLARNITLDSDVAVKLIRRELASLDAEGRLLQEARAAARIDHESIVRIFDFGETEYQDPFIVMEALEGESLHDVLERKEKLLPENAAQTLLPVASALVAAHAKGIVHRDLKPENILLVKTDSGSIVPKVVDFGIAKLRAEDAKSKTIAGVVLGSPDYMSPEQARGREDIDERTDIFSLSIVLYELVSGQKPFFGPNYNALLAAITEMIPQTFAEMRVGDEELWAIVEKGLAKNRDERFSTMKELGEALAGYLLGRGVDVDVTGASISMAWLGVQRRPLSDRPPSLNEARVSWLNKRGSMPSGEEERPTAVPNSAPPISVPATSSPSIVEPIAPSAPPIPTDVVGPDVVRLEADKIAPAPVTPTVPSRALWAVGFGVAAGLVAAIVSSRTHASADAIGPTSAEILLASAAPSASASAAAAASAAASASATASASVSVVDWSACVDAEFPPQTFGEARPDRASVCEGTDPRRGASALHTDVVAAAGSRVTDAMREWALMSWYEMAAFAVVRGRCCPGAPPLVLPSSVGDCPSMDGALNDLATDADTNPDPAIARFRQSISCNLGAGVTADFPYKSRPEGGAETAFRKTLARKR